MVNIRYDETRTYSTSAVGNNVMSSHDVIKYQVGKQVRSGLCHESVLRRKL